VRRDFDFALLIGILLGFVLACLVIFLPFAGLSDFVYRWQTLITGLVAIVAASIALWAVRHQILAAQEMENDRRERRNYAARAMMPHALNSLCTYARGCSDALRSVVDEAPSPHLADVHYPAHLDIPALPDAAMATLKECIEFGDREIQLRLASLVEQLQIQHVRLVEPYDIFEVISGDWYYTLIEDALEIHARSTMLFDYARRRDENAPNEPKAKDIYNALQPCGFDLGEWPELQSRSAKAE
jgi:hypothetical protein